jgi:hypothetical protein
MTPDASQSGLEPAASLTSVRIKRRKPPLARGSKRGDLTAESGTGSPAAPEPVIALPPPASEAAFKEIERIIDRIRPPAAPELPHLFEGLPEPAAAPAPPESPPVIEATAEPAPPEMLPEILDLFDLSPAAPAPEPEMPEASPVVELLSSAMQQHEPEPEPEPDREESSSHIELMAPAPAEPSAAEPANDIEPPATIREGEALELMAPFDEADEAEALEDPLDDPEPEFAPVAAPEPRLRPVLVETPPEPPAEAPSPAALDAEPPPESREADLLDYWDSLRGGRDFPSLDELDRSLVAATWPNTVLLAVDAADMPRITRLGESDGEIEYTATVIDWIMSRGRNAAKRAQPIEEEKRFPISNGSARYRLLLLPFSSYGLKCDHVLGQLTHVAELGAVASFKRWLAS